jgi:hypothetical protein
MLNKIVIEQIEANPLLGAGSQDTIVQLCKLLAGESYLESDQQFALDTLVRYRSFLREEAGKKIANSIPVEKALPSDIGGGRYYWRVRVSDGRVIAAVSDTIKQKGDRFVAQRMAVSLYMRGMVPVSLVPPDYDPQAEDPWTENHATTQPKGMSVRQRTKKV